MLNRQLHPLQVNPRTNEPFLRLPSPFERIIITPPRDADTTAVVEILNDPRVNQWLQGPPYPFLQEHADSRVAQQIAVSSAAFQELKDADAKNPGGPLVFAERCPVTCIREVQPDGSDVYIGDCRMHRCQFDNLAVDGREEERARKIEANNAKPLGDPSIVWSIGNYLAPSHHRQGIMGAVCNAVMHSWAVPRMNAKIMETYAYTENRGSLRVFEKNGFELVETLDEWREVKGVKRGLYTLRWRQEAEVA
ncbi:hypothetical protein FIBSPDRAFT_910082 [Athelia psychrophila]|uniref:N-acetyltransferase domain-containing protein n=1 Tax=Athelia psychrophila TaxID=1759441 RepID=A0A166M8J0_9AGAM|nr:hypothetical protein FIBSPDRAFT_910082 [Fibularhizoctonia sp. CBS 109695]